MSAGKRRRLREYYDTTDTSKDMESAVMSDPFDPDRVVFRRTTPEDSDRIDLEIDAMCERIDYATDLEISQALKLAAMIRKVDGNHALGAYALAEELISLGVTVPVETKE